MPENLQVGKHLAALQVRFFLGQRNTVFVKINQPNERANDFVFIFMYGFGFRLVLLKIFPTFLLVVLCTFSVNFV